MIKDLEGLADAMAGKFLIAAFEAGLIKELGDLVPAVAALKRAAQQLAITIREECKADVRDAVELSRENVKAGLTEGPPARRMNLLTKCLSSR